MPRRSLARLVGFSINGIWCCSGPVISHPSSRNRVLRAAPRFPVFLRGACLSPPPRRNSRPCRHPRNHSRPALHAIAHLHCNLRALRQPKIHARAEAHQSNQFASSHLVPGLFPGNYTPRHPPGNLFENYFPVFARQREHILFVLERSLLRPSRQEFSRIIFQLRDRSRRRRTVHVHIPDRQKNTDALPRTSCVLFFFHNHNAAVRRRHHHSRFHRNFAIRIAEKVADKQRQKYQHCSNRQAKWCSKRKQHSANRQRRKPHPVPFFDHSLPDSVANAARGSTLVILR